MAPEKKAYSVAEAGEALSISGRMVRQALASGALKCVRFGSRIVIPATEIDAFLAAGTETWTPAAVGRGAGRA